MKTLTALAISLALAGCTSTTYTDPTGAKFSRTTLLTNQQFGDVSMKAGDKTLTIGSYSNSHAEATGALIGAALKSATATK